MTITAAKFRELFKHDPETGAFMRLGKGKATVGNRAGSGHIQIQIGGEFYGAHRLAWLYMTGKIINLWHFNTPESAHAAYCAAAQQHFKEFARAA